ncbi:serine/threonine protein kinase [Hyalangium rubrum]|uniref:non-specific serine/threonine protein kinase n=1 Tax=Hyalangium rubrum TaxID=3103134 RepID=A0ABU5GYA8_9BACT|nr:serine/threonine-protein kinase [Hyalangium sp. s54d21]MDY7225864.1 serine/threonine-protein kinase [Hyalangium sp. s54d21]
MTTDALHPDQLQPGHWVGPWRILESLGTGGFGRTFKAEREGIFFSLKMAVRPASTEREVEGRVAHEAAALIANTSHPNLPRLYAVDRWPHPATGYLYFVTGYEEGETFQDWRARTRPNAAQLADAFLGVVSALAELHRRGMLHRDLSGSNILVRKEDGAPVFIDLSSVWLPGASMLTEKLPPSLAHTLPPECVTFLRSSADKEGEPFDAGRAGDLYQLGVLFYEALTECHPFDPKKLTAAELLAAIETLVPRPPHYLNPQVPESLSRIVMRLLEKRPEDRYPSAEVLHQALWEAAKERKRRTWKVPLVLPERGPAPATEEEREERQAWQQETERKARESHPEGTLESSRHEALEAFAAAAEELIVEAEAATRRRKWWWMLATGAVLLGCVLFATWWVWLAPAARSAASSEKGNPPVSDLSSRARSGTGRLAVWLCATFSLGCPGAQVKLPPPGACPQEAVDSMYALEILGGFVNYRFILDIHQPGGIVDRGVYREGPIVGRVVRDELSRHPLPDGTLLYGYLWTEGITKEELGAVMGRYTEALLPDGRRFPVCFVLGDHITGRITKAEGSKPGSTVLPRADRVYPVTRWPWPS